VHFQKNAVYDNNNTMPGDNDKSNQRFGKQFNE